MKIKLIFFFVILGLSGCATVKNKDPKDPFESYNRQVFRFNRSLDVALYRPVARFYVKAVHPKAQKMITNVFNNVGEIPSVVNDIFQLDGYHLVLNTWRFVINTTIGLLGTMDVASRFGLLPYKNDFGLTLYKWGIKKSPYLQIPFLGPSTLRDAIGLGADASLDPFFYIGGIPAAIPYSITVFRAIPARANLLAVDRLMDEAIDPYVFLKNGYLQKREEDARKMRAHLKKG